MCLFHKTTYVCSTPSINLGWLAASVVPRLRACCSVSCPRGLPPHPGAARRHRCVQLCEPSAPGAAGCCSAAPPTAAPGGPMAAPGGPTAAPGATGRPTTTRHAAAAAAAAAATSQTRPPPGRPTAAPGGLPRPPPAAAAAAAAAAGTEARAPRRLESSRQRLESSRPRRRWSRRRKRRRAHLRRCAFSSLGALQRRRRPRTPTGAARRGPRRRPPRSLSRSSACARRSGRS